MRTHTQTFLSQDPLAFVLAANLHRRHLNESQRAMVAARLANMPVGRAWDKPANLPDKTTQPDAAARLNVGERSVRQAKVVQERADPALVRRVDQGEVSVSLAAGLATMPAEVQGLMAAMPSLGGTDHPTGRSARPPTDHPTGAGPYR